MRGFQTSAVARVASAGWFALATAMSVATAYALMSAEFELFIAPLVLAIVCVGALMLTSTAFLIASFAAFATSQLASEYAISLGPAVVYGTDAIVGIVLVRALLPRERAEGGRRLGGLTTAAFAAWIAMMLIAAARGLNAGTPIDNLVRLGMPAIYWLVLYFGLSRTFRERDFDLDRFFGGICAVGVGLVGYMLVMRALGHPFEPPDQIGRLGEVPASSGAVYRRDFGFWSAFIFYPALALLAIARLVYERNRALTWISVGAVGVAATLSTLIRAEIFGLAVGIAAVLVFSGRFRGASGVVVPRRSAVIAVAVVLVAVGAVVTTTDRGFAAVVFERSAGPFAAESEGAEVNREYRVEALRVGRRTAGDHILGLGLLSPDEQVERGADPQYLYHSGYATMLVYLGWPGLVAGLLAIVGLLIDSSRAPAARPWLHPFFGGVLVMLLVSAFGSVGIVGEEQVMALGAFVVAARFAPPARTAN